MTYAEMLIRAYEGEVSGQVFFSLLASARNKPIEKQKLEFLAVLEARTAAALLPILRRDSLTARSPAELEEDGARDAVLYSNASWPEMNARFASDFAPFVDEFREAEKLAPARDIALMELITAHEIAIIDFAASEAAGGNGGMRHLQAYVDRLDAYLAQAAQLRV